jgi:alpha-1,3-glucosyltransferase
MQVGKSEWTLDYPPLFAWLEYVLSQAAHMVDPNIVSLDAINNQSFTTIVFQRSSVIALDTLLILAMYWYVLLLAHCR